MTGFFVAYVIKYYLNAENIKELKHDDKSNCRGNSGTEGIC